MLRTALVLGLAGLAISGCAMTPTVTKAQMTLGEANIEGMECRHEAPPGSVQKQTVCASPAAWANFDKKARAATEDLFTEIRTRTNVGQFNRQ